MVVSAPEVEVQPSSSSTTPVHVVNAEPVHKLIPPPQAKREIVLGLPVPNAIPAAMPKSRKRPCTNPDAAKRRRHFAKFVSLIDGMISECGSEVERLAKDEVERDLGMTASFLLNEKGAKMAKSLELRRLKRKVKTGEESTVCAIGEAKEAVRTEFQTRSARIADSLDSLAVVHARNLVDAEGDFDVILAGLTSECILPLCSGIEFLQTPGRTPASGSPLGGTQIPRYEEWGNLNYVIMAVDEHDELPEATQLEAELHRQIDGLQSQVTELHKTREETNPELSSEFQSVKKKLNEHSKQLEQSAEKLSQLESENLNLRDEKKSLNTASNKKR
ncbi:hypothetical protein DY000_02014478 [Brassica cretica]|uniref:BHLH domain-containing protein n=1 Tax=Brassica cretica TaxID=69181 RepID=A0ABQ7CMV8_BRACR|nr:hypothetical protein DY000_02014478 [Brassica cretica]